MSYSDSLDGSYWSEPRLLLAFLELVDRVDPCFDEAEGGYWSSELPVEARLKLWGAGIDDGGLLRSAYVL